MLSGQGAIRILCPTQILSVVVASTDLAVVGVLQIRDLLLLIPTLLLVRRVGRLERCGRADAEYDDSECCCGIRLPGHLVLLRVRRCGEGIPPPWSHAIAARDAVGGTRQKAVVLPVRGAELLCNSCASALRNTLQFLRIGAFRLQELR
ncbi:hypothetical protein [Microbacterium foliorum]|uniref:hypothetical protein n=1 Tax=Microbacterium foliorum TaxID=104336 RepID=UPI0028D0E57E|nr:hypothetical protein [Microbacterium foliorum]